MASSGIRSKSTKPITEQLIKNNDLLIIGHVIIKAAYSTSQKVDQLRVSSNVRRDSLRMIAPQIMPREPRLSNYQPNDW